MKAFFGNGITAYSGKFDQVLTEIWIRGLLCLARQSMKCLKEIFLDFKSLI